MDLIAKERDRLLQRTARIYGLSFTIVSLICLSIPGSVNAVAYFIALPLYAIVAVSQFRLGVSRSLLWIGPGILAGIAAIVVIAIVTPGGPGAAGVSAAMQLAAASLASFAIVLTTDTVRRILLAGAFLGVGRGADEGGREGGEGDEGDRGAHGGAPCLGSSQEACALGPPLASDENPPTGPGREPPATVRCGDTPRELV